MFVKICGITNLADARAAVAAGAQALGFVFHPASPRYIAPASLAEWIAEIPRSIWRVGVFVNRPPREIESIASELNLDIAQLHGEETPDDAPRGLRVWKAARVAASIEESLNAFPAEAILLDGAGSGQTFDWALARQIHRPVVLAGGLTEHNVRQAMEAVRPWGIDVSSSLELYPGRKDPARMARFIEACQPALITRL